MSNSLQRCLGTRDCTEVNFVDSLDCKQFPNHNHTVHCFIWGPWSGKVDLQYEAKAAVLMQLRSDGSVGFSGGLVNVVNPNANDIVDTLRRELKEEINLNEDKYRVSHKDHYLFTHVDSMHKLLLHFYQLNVTEKEINDIQRESLDAADFNNEVLAVFRVPLYRMKEGRGLSGFPLFLDNVFIGNAKQQLLNALKLLQIMKQDEIDSAIDDLKKIKFTTDDVAAANTNTVGR